jgi:hypothetical protein
MKDTIFTNEIWAHHGTQTAGQVYGLSTVASDTEAINGPHSTALRVAKQARPALERKIR